MCVFAGAVRRRIAPVAEWAAPLPLLLYLHTFGERSGERVFFRRKRPTALRVSEKARTEAAAPRSSLLLQQWPPWEGRVLVEAGAVPCRCQRRRRPLIMRAIFVVQTLYIQRRRLQGCRFIVVIQGRTASGLSLKALRIIIMIPGQCLWCCHRDPI